MIGASCICGRLLWALTEDMRMMTPGHTWDEARKGAVKDVLASH